MQCKRSAVGVAALKGRVYICGGYDGVTSLSTVECYSPKTDTWTTVAPMTKYRSAGGVAALDGYVYALGGHDVLSIFNSGMHCINSHNLNAENQENHNHVTVLFPHSGEIRSCIEYMVQRNANVKSSMSPWRCNS